MDIDKAAEDAANAAAEKRVKMETFLIKIHPVDKEILRKLSLQTRRNISALIRDGIGMLFERYGEGTIHGNSLEREKGDKEDCKPLL